MPVDAQHKAEESLRQRLEGLYERYNHREWVHPDPLVFLYNYKDLRDREIAGLIASSLAYGRVCRIMKSISFILEPMGASPFLFLMNRSEGELRTLYRDFRHRFTSGREILSMLAWAKTALERYGSLYECFRAGLGQDDETVVPALSAFTRTFRGGQGECRKGFLPSPEEGSACKRWHLFLRWMVRQDRVDPGGWIGVSASRLVVPLDTHMHRIALALGFTRRKQADGEAALEVTRAFRKIIPEDPVRYDFALTRLGIRKGLDGPEAQGAESLEQEERGVLCGGENF